MTEERLLTVREVARICHRSEETVRRWIWSGKLPARKLGNQLFIEAGEMDRIQQEQRISEAQAEYRARNREALPDGGDSLKQMEDDKAFQDELAARYGRVDVVALISEPAPRLTERQYGRLEVSERKLRKTLLERHGYLDAAALVRRSREGH